MKNYNQSEKINTLSSMAISLNKTGELFTHSVKELKECFNDVLINTYNISGVPNITLTENIKDSSLTIYIENKDFRKIYLEEGLAVTYTEDFRRFVTNVGGRDKLDILEENDKHKINLSLEDALRLLVSIDNSYDFHVELLWTGKSARYIDTITFAKYWE